MARLPAVNARQVVAALRKAGFEPDRQRGSHLLLKKGGLRVTVSMHRGDMKRGTLGAIIEASSLTEEEFLKLL
ncbi:MAG: type II toxin-antitoxin system HicA family toxin [Planctomycetes bacterium]|nr:type II toxin-antitoxin system HicA family toxin [Planctomycetota bacterium]